MKVFVGGDFCPQERIAASFARNDFDAVLGDIKPILKQADYSIVNLECPVSLGYEKPIEKCGRNLCCSEKGVEALKWAGFDCVTLANNHLRDFGNEGIQNTINTCEKLKIDYVGGGSDLHKAAEVLYRSINGITLAIINCCEHEFSIASEAIAGSNPLNPIIQYYSMKEAREKADYVLVIVHGGDEYHKYPSPRMQEVYRFFINVGADVVVNHHQHCYSGYELYKGKPIFYGLGNFCFDNHSQNDNIDWKEGYAVMLSFEGGVSFELIPYRQCFERAAVVLLNDDEKNIFSQTIEKINQIITDEAALSSEYDNYLQNNNVSFIFEPYNNRYLAALYKRHLLPSFLSKKKQVLLRAYIQCESYLAKVLYSLR